MAKVKLKLLITAGPTREAIDPVRFVSNRSSGILGYTLARTARAQGHAVTLISGPTGLPKPAGVKRIDVETALEMETAVFKALPKADALVMNAAVADFRPMSRARRKIKRPGVAGSLQVVELHLIENPDIVAGAASRAKPNQVVIGFGLETERLLGNAKRKLKSKQLDAIVATWMPITGKAKDPFGNNVITGAIVESGGKAVLFERLSKQVLAGRILKITEQLVMRKKVVS